MGDVSQKGAILAPKTVAGALIRVHGAFDGWWMAKARSAPRWNEPDSAWVIDFETQDSEDGFSGSYIAGGLAMWSVELGRWLDRRMLLRTPTARVGDIIDVHVANGSRWIKGTVTKPPAKVFGGFIVEYVPRDTDAHDDDGHAAIWVTGAWENGFTTCGHCVDKARWARE